MTGSLPVGQAGGEGAGGQVRRQGCGELNFSPSKAFSLTSGRAVRSAAPSRAVAHAAGSTSSRSRR
ncbi:hypothetical protein LP52_09080 [Streptomonospora alba]|uniref:Uncharacterized protein n=1 Tax=Streptomonospora alba TaxID=183763 RepID=A0A0C2G7F9_9ACTN|nr:hypothetical protein LP52_09080 [Streptomonospora alba]